MELFDVYSLFDIEPVKGEGSYVSQPTEPVIWTFTEGMP